jgi:hypothetical protein
LPQQDAPETPSECQPLSDRIEPGNGLGRSRPSLSCSIVGPAFPSRPGGAIVPARNGGAWAAKRTKGAEPRAARCCAPAWRGWRAPDLPRREHWGTLLCGRCGGPVHGIGKRYVTKRVPHLADQASEGPVSDAHSHQRRSFPAPSAVPGYAAKFSSGAVMSAVVHREIVIAHPPVGKKPLDAVTGGLIHDDAWTVQPFSDFPVMT